MRGFLLGVVVGGVAGAAATWFALEKRETGDLEVLASAGDVLDSIPAETGDGDGKKRRGKRRGKRPAGDDGPPELSAADRAMVWRGPAVSPPPRDMDFGAGGAGRTLNQSEINSGIGGRRRQLTDCIIEARGQAELTAKMTLKFLVDENGRVTKARVRAPAYLQKRGLYKCANQVTRTMRFAATGVPTVITLPFELSF